MEFLAHVMSESEGCIHVTMPDYNLGLQLILLRYSSSAELKSTDCTSGRTIWIYNCNMLIKNDSQSSVRYLEIIEDNWRHLLIANLPEFEMRQLLNSATARDAFIKKSGILFSTKTN